MDIPDNFRPNEFSFKAGESKQESKAIADAMRALQQKIKNLEGEKEQLLNHVNYLLENTKSNPSERITWENNGHVDGMKGKMWKMNEDYELALSKSDFFEKELQRKEKQFQIDRETWELEKKTLKKSLEQKRGRIKSPKKPLKSPRKQKNSNKLEEINQELCLELNNLENTLKQAEKEKVELEAKVIRIRSEYDENLSILQNEIK